MNNSTLIAKDNCIMEDGSSSLTKGESYSIESVSELEICILDDQNEQHYFQKKDIHLFFILEELSYSELSLIKIDGIKDNLNFLLTNLENNLDFINNSSDSDLSALLLKAENFLTKINKN